MNQKSLIQNVGCSAQPSEPLSGPAHHHMHLQAVEVAMLARDVASKRSGAFFRRIEPTATDAKRDVSLESSVACTAANGGFSLWITLSRCRRVEATNHPTSKRFAGAATAKKAKVKETLRGLWQPIVPVRSAKRQRVLGHARWIIPYFVEPGLLRAYRVVKIPLRIVLYVARFIGNSSLCV